MADKKETSQIETKKLEKGDQLECGVCGLTVVVDEDCDCADECDIICCGEPMQEKVEAEEK